MIGEPVTVARTSIVVACAIDEDERKLYTTSWPDLVAGDTVSFRDLTRRVIAPPIRWRSAFGTNLMGAVITFEDAPTYLPDTGSLGRPVDPAFNATTGDITSADASYWSGPMRVEPVSTTGVNVIAEQALSIQEFEVSVPLAVTDIQRGDLVRVTSSRDGRLLTRVLAATRVEGGSDQTVRQFRAVDNQGR